MNRSILVCVAFLVMVVQQAFAADREVFSGPQVGEKLVPFTIKGVVGDEADKDVDLVREADGAPIVIVFFHQLTRPAFALTNTVTKMAASRKKDGLKAAVCFLTDDPTASRDRMKRQARYYTKDVVHGLSMEGSEGPGAYGLNRNVTLTVLVAKDHQVTANFALVQPSLQVDGPKIFKAIVDVLGGGKVPDLAEFAPRRRGDQAMRLNPRLQALIRPLRSKDTSPEDVKKAAAAVDEALAKNERLKGQLGRWAAQLVRSGRLDASQTTEPARVVVRKWANKYGRMARQNKKKR